MFDMPSQKQETLDRLTRAGIGYAVSATSIYATFAYGIPDINALISAAPELLAQETGPADALTVGYLSGLQDQIAAYCAGFVERAEEIGVPIGESLTESMANLKSSIGNRWGELKEIASGAWESGRAFAQETFSKASAEVKESLESDLVTLTERAATVFGVMRSIVKGVTAVRDRISKNEPDTGLTSPA